MQAERWTRCCTGPGMRGLCCFVNEGCRTAKPERRSPRKAIKEGRAKTLVHSSMVLREGGLMYCLSSANGELGELGEKRRKD